MDLGHSLTKNATGSKPNIFPAWNLWKDIWFISSQVPNHEKPLINNQILFSFSFPPFFSIGDYSSMQLCVFCPPKIFRVVLDRSSMACAMLPFKTDNACLLEKPQWCMLCCSSPEICYVCFSENPLLVRQRGNRICCPKSPAALQNLCMLSGVLRSLFLYSFLYGSPFLLWLREDP